MFMSMPFAMAPIRVQVRCCEHRHEEKGTQNKVIITFYVIKFTKNKSTVC